jgi:hypothetical protein
MVPNRSPRQYGRNMAISIQFFQSMAVLDHIIITIIYLLFIYYYYYYIHYYYLGIIPPGACHHREDGSCGSRACIYSPYPPRRVQWGPVPFGHLGEGWFLFAGACLWLLSAASHSVGSYFGVCGGSGSGSKEINVKC